MVIMSQSINRGISDRKMPATKASHICLAPAHTMSHLTITITPVKVIVRSIVQKGEGKISRGIVT